MTDEQMKENFDKEVSKSQSLITSETDKNRYTFLPFIQKIDGWILAKDSLPKKNGLFACVDTLGCYSFRHWKDNHFEGEHIANEPKVKYYMLLPELPKE